MKEVFISYESSNQKLATDLVLALEEKGHNCWIALRDVPKGEPYDDHIPKAIAECRIVVMLFSETSLNSPHVKKELRIAVKHDKRVIPFMLENVELREAFEYHIESNNRISADKNWSEAVKELLNSMEHELTEKTKSIKQIVFNESVGKAVQPEYICCPRCSRSSLRFRNGKSHYLDSKKKADDRAYDLFMTMFFIPVMLLLVFVVFCAQLPGDTPVGYLFDYFGSIFFISCILSIVLGFRKANAFLKKWHDIKRSNLQVWNFKCLNCRTKFSYFAPITEKPENRVKELYYEVKK